MPASPVIDAHHHFWQVARGDYHWMSPAEPVLYRDYGPDDLAPLLRKAGVDRTVLVQAAQTEAETAFLLALAERTDFVAGVVGWLDFEAADFEAKLDRLARRPKFVGLRPMLQDLDDDAYILRPAVLKNLAALAERGIALDILTFPRHLGPLAKALEQVPGLRGVVDHISKPAIVGNGFAAWADAFRHIAGFPAIFCKVSGMVTEADHDAWRPADLKPYVEHALTSFGAERLIFGSDWPVCLLAASYAEVLNALRSILDPQLSADEQAAVYGGNAVKFYRLKL
jgi:L-fuconolactonase